MGKRPSAKIVIPVWNRWDQTKPCLDTLRATMGVRDRVVVVDNGSTDDTSKGLRWYPWVNVVSNVTNLGFPAACNQGARHADRPAEDEDVVVFLNNDTVLAGRWLDRLLAPFQDPEVGAVGPRSNFVDGLQMVHDARYDIERMSDYRRFVRQWEQAHQREALEVSRLVGFALAVRRSAFEEVGGFDESYGIGGYEDDDLCHSLSEAGWRLLIAQDSFVHHHGHATFDGNGVDRLDVQERNEDRFNAKTGRERKVLLSACMIVKDEEAILPTALASLNRVVDEVVVYDTGSTDRTIEIALESGARVIEGHWDHDFSRARNASLAECRGEWILHIDADEVLEADARTMRTVLGSARNVDVLLVEIYNLVGDGTEPGYSHRAFRLFRRDRCHWKGHLHEQVCLRDDEHGELLAGKAEGMRLVHSGYLSDLIEGRDKLARNLQAAEAGARTGTTAEPGLADLNLGRALSAIDRNEEAMGRYDAALEQLVALSARRSALMFGAQSLLHLGRGEDALEWAARLRADSTTSGMADLIEAQALRQLGRADEAVAMLRAIGDLTTEDGFRPPAGSLETELAGALLDAGRTDEAADQLLELVERYADTGNVGVAHDALRKAGRPLQELAAVIPEERLLRVAATLVLLEPDDADAIAEGLRERFGDHTAILAAAIRFAPALGTERCLEWASRVRAVGMADACPLVARAGADPVPPTERILAAATAHAAFGDDRAPELIRIAAALVPTSEVASVLGGVAALDPELLDVVLLGAATSRVRCRALAEVLRAGGAPDVADAIEAHAVGLPDVAGGIIVRNMA